MPVIVVALSELHHAKGHDQRFFIKSLAEIEDGDFSRGWWRPDRQRPTLFASHLDAAAE